MVKIPKSVKIGPHIYALSINEELNNDSILGRHHLSTLKMEYATKNIHQGQQLSTILHECIHAILQVYGIMETVGISKEKEEALVVALESSVLSFLRDNPKLIETLVKVK